MWISGLILGLLAAIVSIIAAIKPFKPYKTRKQAMLGAWGFLIVAFISGAQLDTKPVAQAPEIPRVAAQAQAAPEVAAQPTRMSPDEEEQRLAFCGYQHAGNAMMGQYQSVDARETALEPLKRRYFADRGLEYEAVMRQAIAGTWDFECFEGKYVVAQSPEWTGKGSAFGLPDSVQNAEDALTLLYLNRGVSPVSCRTKKINGVYYILCQPSRGGQPQGLYLVSFVNGRAHISPMNGDGERYLGGKKAITDVAENTIPVGGIEELGYQRWRIENRIDVSGIKEKIGIR